VTEHEPQDQAASDEEAGLDRRRALLRASLLAAYTAPMLIGLATAAKAQTTNSDGTTTLSGSL
jgi:hypothetical protein